MKNVDYNLIQAAIELVNDNATYPERVNTDTGRLAHDAP